MGPKVYWVVVAKRSKGDLSGPEIERMLFVSSSGKTVKVKARQFARGRPYTVGRYPTYKDIIVKTPSDTQHFAPQQATYSVIISYLMDNVNITRKQASCIGVTDVKLPQCMASYVHEEIKFNSKPIVNKAKRWCARRGVIFNGILLVEFKCW